MFGWQQSLAILNVGSPSWSSVGLDRQVRVIAEGMLASRQLADHVGKTITLPLTTPAESNPEGSAGVLASLELAPAKVCPCQRHGGYSFQLMLTAAGTNTMRKWLWCQAVVVAPEQAVLSISSCPVTGLPFDQERQFYRVPSASGQWLQVCEVRAPFHR